MGWYGLSSEAADEAEVALDTEVFAWAFSG